MRMGLRRPPTVEEKIEARIARRKGDVFLRADFAEFGSYNQVGLALRELTQRGKLTKIGKGLYARAEPSILDGRPVPVKGIGLVMKEALGRVGVRTGPTRMERAYNEGLTPQVPSGRVIGVSRRVRRRLGYNGATVSFERV